MKRKEIAAAKEAARTGINNLREQIAGVLFNKGKIPEHVVAGKLSDIQRYKEFAEDAGAIYHVKNAPGGSLSLAELQAVEVRLAGIAQQLGLAQA